MANIYSGARVYAGEDYGFLFIVGTYKNTANLDPIAPAETITCDFSGSGEYLPVLYNPAEGKYYSAVEENNKLRLNSIGSEGTLNVYLSGDSYKLCLNKVGNATGYQERVPELNFEVRNLAYTPYFEYTFFENNSNAIFTLGAFHNTERVNKLKLDSHLIKLQSTNKNSFIFLNGQNEFTDGTNFDLNNFNNTILFRAGSETIQIPQLINQELIPFVGIFDNEYTQVNRSVAADIIDRDLKLTFSGLSLSEGKTYYIYTPQGFLLNSNNEAIPETIISFNINESNPGGGGNDPGGNDNPIEPGGDEPITDDTIEYVDPPQDYSYGNGINFDGLVKYYNNNTEITSETKVKRFNDTVLIKSSQVNRVVIFPVLRTRVSVNGGSPIFIKYHNDYKLITVTVTLTLYRESGTDIKIYNIEYDKASELPLNDEAKCIEMKIEFNLEDTHLERTIKFYKLSNILFNRLSNSNTISNNTFSVSEYSSVIDLISGTPVVNKWGCLLLTNKYDVIETKEVENEQTGETEIKGIAELVPITKIRMGNLSGIYNETFGTNQPKGYGLYGESVYLTGNFYLNNGKSLIDIDKDVTMAVGNIDRIQNTLNNLNSTLFDSIYNLTISQAVDYSNLTENINMTAAEAAAALAQAQEAQAQALEAATNALSAQFTGALAANSEALFKLGKDYALWAVGNAGISIINPNVQYDPDDGSIIDSTVGDGDEYIVLQGERVQISTNVVKNQRVKVICSNTDPTSFIYDNNNLYTPTGPNGLQFFVGWIPQGLLTTGTRKVVTPIEVYDDNGTLVTTNKPFRNVALVKHPQDYYNSNITLASDLSNCNFYSFSNSLQLSGTQIYTTYNGDTKLNNNSNSTYYVVQDITTAGMFVDGQFNADLINASLINVENLVAVESNYKNTSFNPAQPINTTTNYPTTNNSKPFAVISGTTGKITAQGVDLKEAVIGGTRVSGTNIIVGKNDVTGEHIRIVDNHGIQVTPDYFNNSSMNASVKDTKPAIYFRNGEEVISKISSDKDTTLEKFFKNSKTTNLVTNVSKTLFNNTSITYNRQLTVASGSIGGPSNKTIIGDDGYYYFKVDKSELSYSSSGDFYGVSMIGIVLYSQPVYRKTGSNTFTQISDNGHISTSQYSAYSEFYYRSNIECDSFLPTRTKLRVKTRSTTNNYVTPLPYCQLYNSDIQKVEYSTSSVTSSNIALSNSNITLSSDNNASYEISGSLKAKLHNSIKLKHLSVTKAENSAVITHSNNLSNGFVKYIDGQLCITLSIILRNVNDSNDYIILKTVKYFTKCTSKTTSANGIDVTTYYPEGVTTYDEASTAENDISNPNVDSIDCNVYEFISNSENNFNDNVIRFSKFIKGDNKTYSLRLLASVDFNQTGRIGDYKFNKQYSNNDNLGPNAYDLPDDPNIINQMAGISFDGHGSSSATSFGTPRDNGYEWHPLLCPKQYTVYPQIDVTNCTINKTLISEKTIIQGNGFLTGYSNQNQFTVSFVEDGDNIIFKKQELIKGVGSILSNNGFFNAFYVNNTLKQIPQPIPILYGSLYPSSRYETVRASKKYEYYSFSGYSLISGNQDNFGGNNDDVFLLNNIFQQIRSYTKSIHIAGRYDENPIIYGNVHYMKNYDLYLISEEGQCGKVVLLFGSQWDQLFVQYGTSLFINVIPKFRNYGSSSVETLVIDDSNNTVSPSIVTSYQKEPIIVDISQTLKDVSFQYQKITGINNNIYTFATQNPIECTSMYGYEFDCYSAWPIVYQSTLDDKYHGALDIVPGYFDIVINYIPNLSN